MLSTPIPATELVDLAWREGLRPEPQLSVSDWADRHRMLPSTSAEPGRWRTSRTPYLRDIMDALSTGSSVERVVFVKGAQLGGTEAGLNWLGYIVHNAPGLALLVMPSLDMARRNTRTRIDPMIEATPVLRERIAPPRAKDSNNTAYSKAFPGGVLVMAGANSAAGLRSTPARYLFLDEVDAFPADADGEGDPVDLALKRTLTFRGKRKILMVSTPTLKAESRIEAAFAESDQRLYHLPCPHCGHMHPLEWEHIRWPEGRPFDAYAVCPGCGGVIEERHKPRMLEAGRWLSGAEGDGRTAGFRLSSLYSPWLPWGDIAVEHERVQSDPPRLQVWTNTVLGLPWAEQGEAIQPDGLASRREAFGESLPADIALLTAGVDVQGNRIELTVVGWGAGEESWIVEHRVIWGDPSGPAIWEDLDRALARRWAHQRAVPDMPIRAVALDTG
ncbi:MAG: terminase gpA endonuclease subunit, partial [Planctomycetota bacterium]